MSDLDEKILKAMKENASNLPDSPEETYVPGLIKQSFKGAFRITFIFIVIFMLIIAGVGAYCAWEMYSTQDIGSKINWLTGCIAAMVAFAIARLWFFMELNRLSVIREIKRVELQLAVLAAKLDN